MKKRFIILICALFLSLGLTACFKDGSTSTPEDSVPTHTHSWESVWEHDDSNHWHVCKDDTCNEVDSKAAHTWDEGTVTKEPTETEVGEKTYKCTVCEETKVEEVATVDHTHKFAEEWSKNDTHHWHAATCEHDTEVSGKAEHDWIESKVSATCTEDGQITYTCETCGATKSEEVPALGHTEVVDEAVDATCTEKGKTEGKHCSVCDEVLVAQEEVPALGHTEVVDEAVDATCTEKGKTEGKHCSVCDEVLVAQEEVPALGHHFVDGKCHCGELYVEEATGEWTLVTELKDGDKVLIGAPAYGKLLSVVKVATYYNKGVNYTEEDFSNVTDTEIFVVTVNSDGTYTFTSLTGKVIAVSASYASLDETSAHKSWILEEKGEGLFYLKNAGRGNYLEWYASKDNWSTYPTTNLTDLFELSFYAQAVAADAEHVHNYISEVHDVTCTEDGYTTFTCECGESYKEEGEKAVGHKYSSEVTAPTCTKDGYTTFTCECGDSYEEPGEKATGHTYVEGKCACGEIDPDSHVHSYTPVVTAPTCTKDGYTTFTCECGDNYEEPGEPMVPHVDTNLDITCDFEGCTKRILPAGDSKISLFTANHMIIVSLSSSYYVEGVITEFTDVKNGFFIIEDEAGDTILIRLPKNADGASYAGWETKLVVGDTVQVYGKPSRNSGTPTTQKAKIEGGVVTVLKHEHVFSDATCTEPSACACLAIGAPALGHIDENADDACDRCSWNMNWKVSNIVIATDPALANGVQTPGSDGKTVSWTWSDDNFDAIIAKGTSTYTVYTTEKAYMQLKKQNTFTLTNKNGVSIKTVTISTTTVNYLTSLETVLKNAGLTVTKDEAALTATIEWNSTENFTFSNTSTVTIYISGVEVVYE